jgi:hydroxyethylthiazole kinase-like uncharacterized protein yjeF
MITVDEMRHLEELSVEHGVTKLQLMENAGFGLNNYLKRDFSLSGKKILIICGSGNNGGDGFVLARYLLQEKFDVNVYFVGSVDKLKKESGYNYFILKDKFNEAFVNRFIDADIYVDAMLGTGVEGPIREPVSSLIDKINASGKIIISVDIPTGVNPDTGQILDKVVVADKIYTFHDIKMGLAKFQDKVTVIHIGIRV